MAILSRRSPPRVLSIGPLILALSATVLLSRAQAIEVCRPNALGQVACSGIPTPELPSPMPYPRRETGLDRVQKRIDPDKTGLIPAGRANSLGETILREGELPPPRPRLCRRDTLGNLVC